MPSIFFHTKNNILPRILYYFGHIFFYNKLYIIGRGVSCLLLYHLCTRSTYNISSLLLLLLILTLRQHDNAKMKSCRKCDWLWRRRNRTRSSNCTWTSTNIQSWYSYNQYYETQLVRSTTRYWYYTGVLIVRYLLLLAVKPFVKKNNYNKTKITSSSDKFSMSSGFCHRRMHRPPSTANPTLPTPANSSSSKTVWAETCSEKERSYHLKQYRSPET